MAPWRRRARIEADGVGELVSVRRGDLRIRSGGEIEHADAPVVVTCYLLPATLRELRPKLRTPVAAALPSSCSGGTAACWQGPVGRRDDRGFTVYKMDRTDCRRSSMGLLGVEASKLYSTTRRRWAA